jgi:hypothetical protein
VEEEESEEIRVKSGRTKKSPIRKSYRAFLIFKKIKIILQKPGK